jgi:hypothetical protein
MPASRQSCGEESELSRILIKNGYVVTIDGARNVYPSAPAAREAGPSFFHEIFCGQYKTPDGFDPLGRPDQSRWGEASTSSSFFASLIAARAAVYRPI